MIFHCFIVRVADWLLLILEERLLRIVISMNKSQYLYNKMSYIVILMSF